MNEMQNALFDYAVQVSSMLLIMAFILAFLRIIIGPTLPDRVVAMDLLAIISTGLISILAMVKGDSRYFDVAITITLVAFLSTIAFGRFIHKTASKQKEISNEDA